MPRLYREAPLYSIWEGSGNVICLDVLRALAKEPATSEALVQELKSTAGADKRLDDYVTGIQNQLSEQACNASRHGYGEVEYSARELTEKLALALQASLLVRYGLPEFAEAFITSRLVGQHGQSFGTLPRAVNGDRILEAVTDPSPEI
jgi:putative acyl-CoA dehydrogenase